MTTAYLPCRHHPSQVRCSCALARAARDDGDVRNSLAHVWAWLWVGMLGGMWLREGGRGGSPGTRRRTEGQVGGSYSAWGGGMKQDGGRYRSKGEFIASEASIPSRADSECTRAGQTSTNFTSARSAGTKTRSVQMLHSVLYDPYPNFTHVYLTPSSTCLEGFELNEGYLRKIWRFHPRWARNQHRRFERAL